MKFCLKASTTLHDQVFEKLMSSPMRFFDVTPSGQILNRFSKDIDEADTLLPFFSDQFFKIGGFVVMSIVLIILAFPLFAIAMIPISALFILLFKFAKRGIQGGKRLDNVTKSPLFSHIATTIQGLETIQAYKMEREFQCRFSKLQDLNSVALFVFEMALRWAAVRCDVLSVLIVFSTFFFTAVVPKDVLSTSMAALALTYAVVIGDLTQAMIRFGVQSEARFTSVKRIINYIEDLESEAPGIIEHRRPPTGWPEEGSIVFNKVNVRYREGLPLVLKNISFKVKPQEKIGIVGRTGSGKSSLALVLFRIMELDGGSITIDGIDINTIGLEDLRSKLSIIPQDPVLFAGTVR
ncbi:hypothetical protein EB796_013942 [Bugula neritina]|uniref:ABC transmembrane type-1 domain-containing protein n=1 Tax=Bugula neritina TaxID=10212 RepID=A0A7J7JPC5_BUGNE|nr:hypothetical protein EB796_013942 [Bugula neritina]